MVIQLLDMVLSNWEVITLGVTNILALFVTPPGKKTVKKNGG